MINRVLRVDKGSGPTSHDVVDQVRRLLRQRRVGHAGTLDPLATGLLLVVAGRATKIAPLLAELPKVYRARARLGIATDTGDREGSLTAEMPIPEDLEIRIEDVLRRFVGEIRQVPPMASAIKIGGEPLHRLRREGKVVDRPERTVVVHRLELLAIERPFLDLRIECSKGTYVRTLAADLAEALGTCGSLAELRREAIGSFDLEGAVSSEELANADLEDVLKRAGLRLGEALAHLPAMTVTEDAAYAVGHGVLPRRRDVQRLDRSLAPGDRARLQGPDGEMVAVMVALERMSGLADDEMKNGGEVAADQPVPFRFWRVLATRPGS
jgi:tRNA pseudouridine55 synthase